MDIIIVSIIIGAFVVFLLWLGTEKKIKPATKKNILIFLVGFETFHALTHFFLWVTNQTIWTPWLLVTSGWNLGSFIVNSLIAIGLLYWASRIKR
jgi:hypothetical protein